MLPGSHEAAAIAKVITSVFDSFEIKMSNVFCGVTDGGGNYCNAITDVLKKEHHICFAHTLNLLARGMLEKHDSVIELVSWLFFFAAQFAAHAVRVSDFKTDRGRQSRQPDRTAADHGVQQLAWGEAQIQESKAGAGLRCSRLTVLLFSGTTLAGTAPT